jgi:hypothetical protein
MGSLRTVAGAYRDARGEGLDPFLSTLLALWILSCYLAGHEWANYTDNSRL